MRYFDFEEKLQQTNRSETTQGNPTEQKAIKEKEEIQKNSSRTNLILTLETVELKLEVGLDSVTKSVVAMCLSNLAANIQIGHQ
ncbi:unnamed protein product, partial [Rotaria sp. Silwood1]